MNKKEPSVQNENLLNLVLILIGGAFVVNDWIIGLFSFSDIILGLVFLILISLKKTVIHQRQIKILLIIFSSILFNSLLNYIFNNDFIISIAFAGTIKLIFYAVMIVLIYNFILYNELYYRFVAINNTIMIIISLIGLYILLSLYVYDLLPFEFFWTFTRNDGFRYIGEQTIFRVNSIFSEPAHFGYYLNTIILMNLNISKIKNSNLFFIFAAIIMNLMTLSYSSIGIMLITLSLYYFKNNYEKRQINNKIVLVGALATILLIFFQWDFINETLIQRSINILSGEDSSGINRLIGSWQYVNTNNIVLGNGIGHTPSIWSVYAYAISDLGLIGMSILIALNIYILKQDNSLGILFLLMNIAKGGYLSPIYWLMVVCFFLMINEKNLKPVNIKEG